MSKFIVLMSLLFTSSAFAQKYVCDVVEHRFWESDDAIYDTWTATVDLGKGVAQLSSDNKIFGKNPFAVLKASSPRGYVAGTFVFRGQSKGMSYTLSISAEGLDGALEYTEDNQGKSVASLENCRKSR